MDGSGAAGVSLARGGGPQWSGLVPGGRPRDELQQVRSRAGDLVSGTGVGNLPLGSG